MSEGLFEIKNMKDLMEVMTIARGGNPFAQQALEKFIDLDSPEERSYFPDKLTSLAVAQNLMYSQGLFPQRKINAFSIFASALSKGYMGYKGFKSNQWVDITRQTTNLDALRTLPEDTQRSALDSILRRGKTE